MNIIADNMDDLINAAIEEILTNGRIVFPRGMQTKEIIGAKIILTTPKNRILYNPERKFKLSYAIGEFLWYISGSSECEFINYYNTRYYNYSDNGIDLNGAYGKRIFCSDSHKSQWKCVYELLKRDPDTRQAVISIFKPHDIRIITKDVPCTNTIQFFIRDQKLDCIVYMRSNDLMWGTPYDIFSFTMMQEMMANSLGVDMGKYIHMVGSLHIYERHFDQVEKMLMCKNYKRYTMPSMPIEDNLEDLIICAKKIRKNSKLNNIPKTQYSRDLISVLYKYAVERYKYPYIYSDLVLPEIYNLWS